MAKKTTAGLRAQRMPAAAAVMLFRALATSCAQTPRTSNSQPQQQATPQAQQTPPPRPAKVVLNAEEMGTTADLSGLDKLLTKVMKEREEQGVWSRKTLKSATSASRSWLRRRLTLGPKGSSCTPSPPEARPLP